MWAVLAYFYRKEKIEEGAITPTYSFFAELFYGIPVSNFVPKEITKDEIPLSPELIKSHQRKKRKPKTLLPLFIENSLVSDYPATR
jgi:hypothetical protein